jgi:hypothetical protein
MSTLRCVKHRGWVCLWLQVGPDNQKQDGNYKAAYRKPEEVPHEDKDTQCYECVHPPPAAVAAMDLALPGIDGLTHML